MKDSEIIGLALVSTALFVAAWVMNTVTIASSLLSATLPWICTMIGIVLLILGATCLILQRSPSQVPLRVAVTICAATSLGLLVGMFVDLHYFYPDAEIGVDLIEWIGFTLILCMVFFVPRIRSRGA